MQRLELTWVGKENRITPEPRILLEDKEKSYSAKVPQKTGLFENETIVKPTFDNMLIHGDNLLVRRC